MRKEVIIMLTHSVMNTKPSVSLYKKQEVL